jgi:tRNA(fMet)-specific endonuclease VapC
MILLDTDILSLLMQGHERVRNRIEQATTFAIPIISRIEVLEGRFASLLKAADGTHALLAQQWLEQSENYMRELETIPFDEAAASRLDRLLGMKFLKKIGRADLLIAAIALARNALLVTRNTRHFELVPGLQIENWAD